MMSDGLLTAPEQANLLAAQAVAGAQGYFDGRWSGSELAEEAGRILDELDRLPADPRANAIADPTRLLITAMVHTATSTGTRAERWADVMAAFVPLLRQESTELAASGAQRQ
jgi:hypothetical protein